MNSFLYTIKRFGLATMLNILGLIVSFAAFYIFMTQVVYNSSYNKCFTDYKNVYRAEVAGVFDERYGSAISRPLAEHIASLPQVEGMGIFSDYYFKLKVVNDGHEYEILPTRMTPSSFAVFRQHMISGVDTIDYSSTGVIIPASYALKCFGTTEAAGQSISFEGQPQARVAGVYADFPPNCEVANNCYLSMGDENKKEKGNYNYKCFVRLKPDTDIEAFSREVCSTYNVEDEDMTLRFVPVADTYFSGVSSEDKGNSGVLLVLQVSCLLLLLIACINFMNVSLAEMPFRVKGITTRKVLGSPLWTLRLQLLMEGVMQSLFAFVVAMATVYVLDKTGVVAPIVTGSIAFDDNKWLVLLTLGVSLLVGIVAMLYPTFFATSFQPYTALRGSFGLSPRGVMLRRCLTFVQTTIAMLMVSYIGVLYLQSYFIYHSESGFDKEEMVYAFFNVDYGQREALRDHICSLPEVEGVTYSSSLLGSNKQMMVWGRGEVRQYFMNVMPVDWQFLKVWGVKVIEDRDFLQDDPAAYIINKAARDKFDWQGLNTALSDNYSDPIVVGVCDNIRFFNTLMDNATEPCAFVLSNSPDYWWTHNMPCVSVRLKAGVDKVKALAKVTEAFNSFIQPEKPVEFAFFDKRLQESYKEEFRFISQVEVFSALCVLITLIGVFCLTMFEVTFRRKEVAIRKVLGSSVGEIVVLFTSRHVPALLLSFVVSAPLSYYMSASWLENFAEHTSIPWWIFPLGFVAVSAVVLLTVILQAYRAAVVNPAENIKTE